MNEIQSPPACREQYEISTIRYRLNLDFIHGYLQRAYWSPGVPREVVARSISHSLPFGVYTRTGEQVGFGRAVTDRSAFAYLGDVFVIEEHRGRGLGVWLIESMLAHPWLQGLRRIYLVTADAHSLYTRFGFRAVPEPANCLELIRSPEALWGDSRLGEQTHGE
jgi:GNAT superfamily N-acetyltransferase